MEYIQLGKRGPKVSRIGFGSWAIGNYDWGKTDDEVSKNAIYTALDNGVNLIDTADVYGFGHSEELIADVIKERGKENIIVASKAANDFYNNGFDKNGYPAVKPNCKKEYLIFAVEKSLKRLNIDALDIFQIHSPETAMLENDEPWEAASTLKQQGKVKHVGLSIKSFKETEQAFLLDIHHDILDCLQVRYNLLEREAEKILFPKAEKYGIGIIVRIPLLFGLLTGKFTKETRFEGLDHRRNALSPDRIDKYMNDFEKLEPLYQKFPGYTKAQISLRFCISHPACQTVIPGGKTPAQVLDNLGALGLGPVEIA